MDEFLTWKECEETATFTFFRTARKSEAAATKCEEGRVTRSCNSRSQYTGQAFIMNKRRINCKFSFEVTVNGMEKG